jgi:hypothetical protein
MSETHSIQYRGRNLTGEPFGRWVVIGFSGPNPRRGGNWSCRCKCGAERVVIGESLTSGKSTSCGCLFRENSRTAATTHGHTRGREMSPEYGSWRAMVERCTNPANKCYPLYGGRGIVVCGRWRDSFEAFLEDMGARLSPKHSLDRIDPNGGYEPENCRWLTHKEQCRNRRRHTTLTHLGETLCVSEWAERIGISVNTLHYRLSRGWDAERTLTEPVRKPNAHNLPGVS